MIDLSIANKLIDDGFSLITVGEDKVPIGKWTSQQTKAVSKQEFKSNCEYSKANSFGIVTGYNHLECVDVDLKVFSTPKERKDFWNEYLSMLEDNIDDFHDKFKITKTKNFGYHILYKSKRVVGNKKIASLKGHKEAIIESRGLKGYVFYYNNFLNGETYSDTVYVSDEDREILWTVSQSYNYVEPEKDIVIPKKTQQQFESGLKPWEDFVNKNNTIDVVRNDFSIVRTLSNKIILKRHGSESVHSGYIFNDNDTMYLHSTGTNYPHEKALNAWQCYVHGHFKGDFSEAAKQAYKDGYGDRVVKKVPKVLSEDLPKIQNDIFPIDVFPKPISNYILDCNNTLDSVIDYMGGSMLWMVSVIIGNTLEVEVKKGWKEKPILWISNVGKAGIGKTPSIKNIIAPLQKANSNEIKNFIKQSKKFEEYDALSKEEKKTSEEIKKPIKSQFIANDITIEALVDLHQESKNSVGVFKDELAGWLKDMNKYREGSDLEFWLSSWSNESVNVNRMSRVGSFIESPYIPVLGGIQPNILNGFFTSENKNNGFIDRLLITYPEAKVEKFNDKEMSYEALQWYSDTMTNFYNYFKFNFSSINEDLEVETKTAKLSDEAKKEWKKVFNKYTEVQNGDFENEYLKSMYPKQKSYIPRFALIIHALDCYINNKPKDDYLLISLDAMEKAIRLSEYFINMAKKVKIKGKISNTMNESIKNPKGVMSDLDKVKKVYSDNSEFNRSELAELLGVTRQSIQRHLKKIKEDE